MRERIRLIIAAIFYYSGIVGLAHRWREHRYAGRQLIILNYHQIEGTKIRSQLRYLSRHYRILRLEDALDEFYTPGKKVTQTRDRRLPIVLTFDDGYRDNYTSGLPLVREFRIPITIFLVPGYIASGKRFWWLEGERLARLTQVDEVVIEGQKYHLSQPEERSALAKTIDTHLRVAKTVEEREAFLAEMYKVLAVPLDQAVEDGTLPMTWEEVCEMKESGWVSFGAHTMNHPILAHLTDTAELQYEVEESRLVLEKHLGHPIRTFAYPVGKWRHIEDSGLRAVQAAEFTYALTTVEEGNTPQTNPYLLSRLPGDLDQHWLIMASELVGLLGILSRLRKKI